MGGADGMKKKLLVLLALAGVVFSLYLFDLVKAKGYNLTATDISPKLSYADGKTPVHFTVRVNHNGKPVQGHVLYVISKGGGSFNSDRIVTDTDGNAGFIYYPYLESDYQKAGKVPIQVLDESNSTFISVPAETLFTIQLISPVTSDKSEYTTTDIYGK